MAYVARYDNAEFRNLDADRFYDAVKGAGRTLPHESVVKIGKSEYTITVSRGESVRVKRHWSLFNWFRANESQAICAKIGVGHWHRVLAGVAGQFARQHASGDAETPTVVLVGSGKDREPGEAQKCLTRQFLFNGGNFELQRFTTGLSGYKVGYVSRKPLIGRITAVPGLSQFFANQQDIRQFQGGGLATFY